MTAPTTIRLLGHEVAGTDSWQAYRFPFLAHVHWNGDYDFERQDSVQWNQPVIGKLIFAEQIVFTTEGPDPAAVASAVTTRARELVAEMAWYTQATEDE